jgi:SAM-dependent methyltransferase
MESVTCIFCNQSSENVAIKENGYQGRRCVTCGLIYISPRPSPSETTQLYTVDHAALYADAQLHFEGFKQKEANETLDSIKKFRKDGALLELGPGGGAFLTTARSAGFAPYAIELNPMEATWINEKLNIPCESAAMSPNSFGGKKFDVVYHRDVLSHLYDPISTFRLIHQSLKDKGLLVFETGNIADVNPKYLSLFSQFLYPDHLFFFGENSLQLLLQRTGFRCLKVYRISLVLPLMLEKALWSVKDKLKDGDSRMIQGNSHALGTPNGETGSTVKRKVRLLYRYTSHYLSKVGEVLPKSQRPLKLVVVAEKQ